MRLEAFPGERPVVSGGVPLVDLEWTPHAVTDTSNVWVASLAMEDVPGLQMGAPRPPRGRFQVGGGSRDFFSAGRSNAFSSRKRLFPHTRTGGARLTRARYPNLPGGIEVACGVLSI